eukprot:TRINITY_DN13281_c0_g1_i1.p1 TRINITY_DN13281_c0_g1~~TRINITY_DN13281_c0_g1_i1.p1  ORF type:complete len:303 (+),score=29.16 TRINITY_DN13281_c0_g1_i1:125-1033(+)
MCIAQQSVLFIVVAVLGICGAELQAPTRLPQPVGRHPDGRRCRYVGFAHCVKCGGTGMLMTLNICCRPQLMQSIPHNRTAPGWFGVAWKHATALEERGAVGLELWRRSFTFGLARNPWGRHVSRFFFLSQKECSGKMSRYKELHCGNALLLGNNYPRRLNKQSFRDWTMRMYKAYPPGHPQEYLISNRFDQNKMTTSPHYFGAAQWYWFSDTQGKLIMTKVIKLEKLKEYWPYLQANICGLASVSYAEHSTRGRGVCAGAGSCADAKAAVQRRYQDYYDTTTKRIIDRYMRLDIINLNYTFH